MSQVPQMWSKLSASLVLLNIPGNKLIQLNHCAVWVTQCLLKSSLYYCLLLFPGVLLKEDQHARGESHLVLCCRMWLLIDQAVLGNKRLELTGCQINSTLLSLYLSVCLSHSFCFLYNSKYIKSVLNIKLLVHSNIFRGMQDVKPDRNPEKTLILQSLLLLVVVVLPSVCLRNTRFNQSEHLLWKI